MSKTIRKSVKKTLRLAILVVCLTLFGMALVWCSSRNITDKNRIISIYRRHESEFAAAAATGDCASVERIWGVTGVGKHGEEIAFSFGGRGLVPNSSYYGLLYIPGAAGRGYAEVFGSSSHWSADGEGYRYIQGGDGDNEFYYESLGSGFYYYEEHY